MTDVIMPRLSDSMEEGTILKWLKAPGDGGQARRADRGDRDRQGDDDLRGRRRRLPPAGRLRGRHAGDRRRHRAPARECRRGVGASAGRERPAAAEPAAARQVATEPAAAAPPVAAPEPAPAAEPAAAAPGGRRARRGAGGRARARAGRRRAWRARQGIAGGAPDRRRARRRALDAHRQRPRGPHRQGRRGGGRRARRRPRRPRTPDGDGAASRAPSRSSSRPARSS